MEGSLEKRLYDAAAEGNTRSLQELLEKDKFVVDRVSFTCTNKSPLHVATMNGHFAFVEEILILNPLLAQQLDSQQSSPLHIASAEGYLEIVKKLLSAAPHMCLSRDCQGRNPLHLAAMRGHVEILKTFIQEAPSAVWEKADRDQTVLHLCVKHRQLEALKILAPNLNLNPNLENRFYKLLEKDPKRDAKSQHELLEEDPKRVEKRLYDAAAEGNTESLQELLEKDEFVVDRVSFTSPNKTTPLHVATMNGHFAFVQEILILNPRLAQQLDSQQSSPLHIASAEGYLEIVKKLLSAAPHMCLSRDCQGRNPLHLAAMKGHVDILDALIQEAPSAAREMVDRDQTVLHLCVKHGQLDALKILAPKLNDRIDAKAEDGDTILHMAVALKQTEIIKYLVEDQKVDLNVRNSNEETAIEILEKRQPAVTERNILRDILRKLRPIDAKIRTQTQRDNKWSTEKGNTIMVVAVLTATMAFQAGVSPAGGIWQENSTQYSHARAGEAVMAYTHPVAYKNFMRLNLIAFVSSVTTIMLLMSDLPVKNWLYMRLLIIIMWLTLTSLTVSYAISVFVVTPITLGQSMPKVFIMIGLGAWFGVVGIGILLMGSILIWLKTKRIRVQMLRLRIQESV